MVLMHPEGTTPSDKIVVEEKIKIPTCNIYTVENKNRYSHLLVSTSTSNLPQQSRSFQVSDLEKVFFYQDNNSIHDLIFDLCCFIAN